MAVDLAELLRRAAHDAGGRLDAGARLDAECLVDAGLRRRSRRRLARAAGAVAVLTVVAVGAVALPGTRVELADQRPQLDWPLAMRYELTREPAGADGQRPSRVVGEFAANGWDDWVHVAADVDRLVVERYGPAHRYGAGDLTGVDFDEPFAALEAAAAVELSADRGEPPTAGLVPNDMLNLRFAHEPQAAPDATVVVDLPELRRAVADRLAVDADTLRAARIERSVCWDGQCGTQTHTFAWLPDPGLPLYAEEVDPDGFTSELVVTHLRTSAGPPPNALPLPPPSPPEWTPEPVPDGELTLTLDGVEFRYGEGSHALFDVRNPSSETLAWPRAMRLQRFDGQGWLLVAEVTVEVAEEESDHSDAVAPGGALQLRVRLPDDVQPAFHRLVAAGAGAREQIVGQFFYAGDPNR